MLSDTVPKSVAYLRSLVADGETRVFKAAAQPSGDEPAFYRVSTSGEFMNVLPNWENRPSLDQQPQPKATDFIYRSLSSAPAPAFSFNGAADILADFYQINTFCYLVSDALFSVVQKKDPGHIEHAAAVVRLADRTVISGFKLVMPTRVLDVVDTEKTSVSVQSQEPVPGAGRYVTHVWYNDGYVVKGKDLVGVQSFVEEFRGTWLWRDELFSAAASAGARGIRGTYTNKLPRRPDIRI